MAKEHPLQEFDLIVVGAGPGGYVAAIRAAQLGMRTAIVEKQHMGGVCLNWGCIPTKSLLKSAEIYEALKQANKYGIQAGSITVNLADVVQRSRDISERLSHGIDFLMKKNQISVFNGTARLVAKASLQISQAEKVMATLSAPHIIFATGANPRTVAGMEVDGKVVWGAREAMTPEQLPESLLVVGSGAIGIEFASFYRSFGVEVTVIEMQDRILPQEDADVSEAALRCFKRRGIKFHTGVKLEQLHTRDNKASAFWSDREGNSEQQTFDRVIMAVGIVANIQGLGLEEQGVKLDRGQVKVNPWGETSVDGIYAIGDMTAPPWLAHKASHEAVICVEKIAGLDGVEPIEPRSIPACTYSSPQIASVGMTESEARKQGIEPRIGKFDLANLGMAQAMGETEGFVKTVFDSSTGELLGAHMVGTQVTELIQGFVIALQLESTEEELMHTVFAHPTLSEAMHESVLNAFDRAIHC